MGLGYPKYINCSYNSIKNKATQSKNELKPWIDIFFFLKKTHGWLTSTWQVTQYHEFLEKWKSKQKWHIILVRMTTIRTSTNHNVEEDVMERAPLQTVDRNVNWYRHCGKQYGNFSKGKNRTNTWLRNYISEYLFKVNENTDSYVPIFIISCLQ